MKAMLTSSLGGSSKVNGTRIPAVLIQYNGLLDRLKSIWKQNARVLIICADPSDYEKNDSVYACLKEALPMSGLSVSYIDKCDDRNLGVVDDLGNTDVLILAGGHEIIALNDGSYILIEDEKTTLYGEAYMIKDGQQTQICKNGEFITL